MGQGGRWAKISLLLIFAQELFSDPVLFRFNRNCVCVFVSKIVNITGLSPSFYFMVEDMRHGMSTKSWLCRYVTRTNVPFFDHWDWDQRTKHSCA